MDLAAKRRSGVGWLGLLDPGPAEGAMVACFASWKQIRILASAFRLCAFNTALARKGLAVFKRYAHSAGPGPRIDRTIDGGRWVIFVDFR